MSILKELEEEHFFFADLSDDKERIELTTYIKVLDKEEFGQFIDKLKELHKQMED